MNKRFKPILAAAVAAGFIPVLDQVAGPHAAFAATVAVFTFESLTGATSAASSSFSFTAENGLATGTFVKPGGVYAAASSGANSTVMSTIAGSLGTAGYVGGNGSAKSFTAVNLLGSSTTFAFSLDNLQDITFNFDTTGSGTAPRDYVVRYSLDGTNFTSLASYSIASVAASGTYINSTGGTSTASGSGFTSSASNAGLTRAFALPASFSDLDTGALGAVGYLQILQSGTAGIATPNGPGSAGTFRLDNVTIAGTAVSAPEPAAAAILTLASAGLGLRRKRRA